MIKKLFYFTVIAAVASGAPIIKIAQAEETSQNLSLMSTLKDKLLVSYFGYYRGGSLNDPGNSFQPGIDGVPDATAPQGLENFVTTGYKFHKDWVVGVSTHFLYNAVASSMPIDSGTQSVPAGITTLNPSFVLSKSNLINQNGFKLKGYLFASLPVSRYDYISAPGRKMITAIEPAANFTYDVPKTKLTLGVYGYVNTYFASAASPDGLRTYKVYAAPNANYQFTPRFAGTLWVDLIQAARNNGTGFISGLTNGESDIEPGVNWDVIPGALSVNPSLNIYPAHPTLASTSIIMVIAGNLF